MSYYTLQTFTRFALARAENVQAVSAAIVASFNKVPPQLELEQNRATYAADTGAADVYAVALPHTLSAYTAGLTIWFKATNANTGASTLNVDTVGAVAIKQYDGSALESGDIPAGGIIMVTYDGTNFVMFGAPGSDAVSTAADVVSTNADVVSTGNDVTSTNADVVSTNADVVSTNADVVTAAASAAAAAASAAAAGSYDMPFVAGFVAGSGDVNLLVATYGKLVVSRAGSFTGETGTIDTAATGAAAIFDIEKNGTTIYATKPQFAISGSTITAGVLKTDGTEDFVAGDKITFKCTQIGSTIAGKGVDFTAKAQVT